MAVEVPDNPYWMRMKPVNTSGKITLPDGTEHNYEPGFNIKDGDSYICRLDMGMRHDPVISVRLNGVDTPETYGVRGTCPGCKRRHTDAERGREAEAAQFVKVRTEQIFDLAIRPHKKSPYKEGVAALSAEKAKYEGRLVCGVFIYDGNIWIDVAEQLLREGLAAPYTGETKNCFLVWWKR